jgi:hypothetical protein
MAMSRRVRMAQAQTDTAKELSPQSKSESGILVLAEPVTLRRFKAVLAELTTYISTHGDGPQRRQSLIMKYMARAITEELEDVPQEAIGPYFEQIGKIISWIGSGNDDDLPPGLREYLSARMGTDNPPIETDDDIGGILDSTGQLDESAIELEQEATGY